MSRPASTYTPAPARTPDVPAPAWAGWPRRIRQGVLAGILWAILAFSLIYIVRAPGRSVVVAQTAWVCATLSAAGLLLAGRRD